MNDRIKLPENNYAFKKTYKDKDYLDNFTLNEIKKDKINKKNEKKDEKNEKMDDIEYVSKEYVPKRNKEKTSLEFCDREIYKKHKFELDMFKLSDYEFVNWANQQSEFLIMAIMAEMKKSPKMRDEIERLRPEVYKIPLMPIHEYKKIRKLGDRYTSFLRQLKHEYGNNLLRLLYLTSNLS
jgi:hypothetical protein